MTQYRDMKSAKAKKRHKPGKQTRTSIVNPDHPIPTNVARALRSHRESDSAALARKYKIAALARPTAEDRKAIIQASGKASVADIEKLFEIRKKVGARVQDAIKTLPPTYHYSIHDGSARNATATTSPKRYHLLVGQNRLGHLLLSAFHRKF